MSEQQPLTDAEACTRYMEAMSEYDEVARHASAILSNAEVALKNHASGIVEKAGIKPGDLYENGLGHRYVVVADQDHKGRPLFTAEPYLDPQDEMHLVIRVLLMPATKAGKPKKHGERWVALQRLHVVGRSQPPDERLYMYKKVTS